jgi:hypothetical protein
VASAGPETVRVCLCGRPADSNRRMPASLRESLEAARRRRAENEIEALRARWLEEIGSGERLSELESKLSALEKVLGRIRAAPRHET